MSRNNNCGLYLLEQISGIYKSDVILWRMIVWITIISLAFIILNLYNGRYTLLTEGAFIPSVTAFNDTRLQVEWIRSEDLAQVLSQYQ
jgi:hypothetical protein